MSPSKIHVLYGTIGKFFGLCGVMVAVYAANHEKDAGMWLILIAAFAFEWAAFEELADEQE